MSRRSMVIGAVALVVVLVGVGVTQAVGYAQETAEDCRAARMMKMLRGQLARAVELREELDLTEEQRGQLKGIAMAHRDELRPLMGDVLTHKRALREAVLAEEIDEAAIRAEAEALGEAIGDAALAMAEVGAEMREVLTDRQLELIRESAEEREAAAEQLLSEVGQ